jgi:hypothetical protein
VPVILPVGERFQCLAKTEPQVISMLLRMLLRLVPISVPLQG